MPVGSGEETQGRVVRAIGAPAFGSTFSPEKVEKEWLNKGEKRRVE